MHRLPLTYANMRRLPAAATAALPRADLLPQAGLRQAARIPRANICFGRCPGYHYITSYFGPRDLAGYKYHYGIDISGSGVYGHDIVAAESGTVLLAQTDKSWGKFLLIDHGNGMLTRYAHCSKLLVSQGDRVKRGQVIAKVGDTGNVTGPHLHFEVYEGDQRYNPLNYLDPKDYK